MTSVIDGIEESDRITILEVARVATECCSKRLSSEMNFSLEFFRKMNKCLTKRLDPVYGSHMAEENGT